MLRTSFFAIALLATGLVHAQTPPGDLTLTQVSGNFTQPVAVRHAGDDSGRLFVLEKRGIIQLVKNGVTQGTPFLDLRTQLPFGGGIPSQGDERGLLGLAFHPNYEQNGIFFVSHTQTDGRQGIARYQVSAGNPDVADAGSRTLIIALNDPASNHNGGDIVFGPDGYLYYSMGDGGPQGDPNGFAQCLWRKPQDNDPTNCTPGGGTNYALLGKLMRLNIDQTTASASAEMCGVTTGQPANYAIPADNPFVGSSNTCDEIYAYGMRNPWRISFDRVTGDLYVGDVGQGTWEEVTVIPAGVKGANLGWRCFEGTSVFNATGPCSPAPASVAPFQTYQHASVPAGFRCSISGGYRYRGPIQGFRGVYVYGDYCTGEVFFATRAINGTWSGPLANPTQWQDSPYSVVGFGEDEAGNLYLINQPSTAANGSILRFSSASENSAIFEYGMEGGG